MDDKSHDSAFEALGLKTKAERTALLVLIVSQILPFVETLDRQNRALKIVLCDQGLDATVRSSALAMLEPATEGRSK